MVNALELAMEADVLIHDAQLVGLKLASEGRLEYAGAEYAVELGRLLGAGS
jgi:hypothetical protein